MIPDLPTMSPQGGSNAATGAKAMSPAPTAAGQRSARDGFLDVMAFDARGSADPDRSTVAGGSPTPEGLGDDEAPKVDPIVGDGAEGIDDWLVDFMASLANDGSNPSGRMENAGGVAPPTTTSDAESIPVAVPPAALTTTKVPAAAVGAGGGVVPSGIVPAAAPADAVVTPTGAAVAATSATLADGDAKTALDMSSRTRLGERTDTLPSGAESRSPSASAPSGIAAGSAAAQPIAQAPAALRGGEADDILPGRTAATLAAEPAVPAPPSLAPAPVAEPARQAAPVPMQHLGEAMQREAKALVEKARAEVATRRQGDGSLTTEIELAPAELGKLRLVLMTGERGLHLTVHVDRPESLEAVRRQLEGFHRSLLSDGVSLEGVDIGSGDRGRRALPDRHPAHDIAARDADPAEKIAPPHRTPTPSAPPGRLDIRI